MAEIYKITLWIPDQKALKEIVSAAHITLNCGNPKQDADGNFIITAYGSPDEVRKIIALNYKFELDEKFGDEVDQLQKQISRIDRFDGGRIVPKGLGISLPDLSRTKK
jgi:hypothetical protein